MLIELITLFEDINVLRKIKNYTSHFRMMGKIEHKKWVVISNEFISRIKKLILVYF